MMGFVFGRLKRRKAAISEPCALETTLLNSVNGDCTPVPASYIIQVVSKSAVNFCDSWTFRSTVCGNGA